MVEPPRTLHLVLTHHWFDEITAGRKLVEYRALTRHWAKRIWNAVEPGDLVCFSRGYTQETITRRITQIDVGDCPYDGWDALYYRVHFSIP